MADITAKLFRFPSREWIWAMADKLTDIVYTDDSKETINLLGWILLGLVVFIIGNVVATYLRKKKSLVCSSSEPETPTTADDNNESVPCANDIQKIEVVPEETQIPTCEGEDEEFCTWVNSVTHWIYTNKVVSPIIDSWLTALNARTRLSSTEHGILVDFRDLLPTSGPPKLTQLRQNTHARHDTTGVSCDMEFENIAFEVVVTQFKGKEKVLIPFVLQVNRLQGKVGIECSPEDVSFVAKYSEPPQIDLDPQVSNDTEVPPEECPPLCAVVAEISSSALGSAILPLRLSCFPDCPRIHTQAPQDVFEEAESNVEKGLLVKVVKATQLGGAKGCCVAPYCVVEMDDPPQRFETGLAHGTSPSWEQAFTFSIKDPAELLFEVYDKECFLGLGLVGVEELLGAPCQRQVIPLQSRPLQEDDVTGTLTVEFSFVDVVGGCVVEEERPAVQTNCRVTAGGTVITTTTIHRRQQDDACVDVALQQLGGGGQHVAPSKSTLIIHSVQRPESSVPDPSPPSQHSSPEHSPAQEEGENGVRGRVKEKGFLGTLRRRLSFHRTRSKSSNQDTPRDSSRSASSDRHPPPPSPFKARIMGGQLLSPAAAGSTRSSLSEASGISARTYIHDNSTLVVETNENGIVKRYLIPNSLIQRSKWKKKGTKLHIYNDHVFVARHLSGSTQCQVCRRHLTRRPGKQGYQCRGCDLQCHKSCHVRVDAYCPNSPVNAMEVEYIHDPKGASPKSI